MRIANLRSWQTGGTSRVEANVDDEPLWFASDDATLVPSPEAFASSLLIAAATRGEPLEIEAPVDRFWFERVPGILRQADEWWRLPGTRVIAPEVIDAPRARPGVTAQCFTGGVDSFYTLISAKPPPKILVFAHGLDIGLDERDRLDAFLLGFREIAAAFDAKPVLIATNLLEHRASLGVDSLKSHGGVLAALGHLLADEVERIVIPPSYNYHEPMPWGSHWDLDPLWSSRRLTVEHADATFRRGERIRRIADNELVHRHLRVCFGFRNVNCSRCEKCVRTMIGLAICGQLDNCKTFDRTVPLEQLVKKQQIVSADVIAIYEDMVCRIDDPRLNAAVRRLIADSRGRPRWFYKELRSLRRRLYRVRLKRLGNPYA